MKPHFADRALLKTIETLAEVLLAWPGDANIPDAGGKGLDGKPSIVVTATDAGSVAGGGLCNTDA